VGNIPRSTKLIEFMHLLNAGKYLPCIYFL
jgi:hypothetical protein